MFEVVEGAVVGVDDGSGDVAGGGGAVEGGEDAGVVLEGIAAVIGGVDVLGRGPDMRRWCSASKASISILTGLLRRTL